ncbi:hypothetical protein IDJ77_04125 [Mucilaginibacter sp. ZT4R22]|uniref:DUF6908 domain-containing protein n=1 Tax=Mucilaginibacter pankratovii TaxID=2772110 RepID=A0ABR7WNP1_9SPHI|nr:hypothetical protein [Mucilaginibacter pankratovii]MBD1362989.1 hypothetical protein [Mucilaginibacter pankratovii]
MKTNGGETVLSIDQVGCATAQRARFNMETLNKFSTKIFCELVDKMQGKQHLKIFNEPFMPLTIERAGTVYWGHGEIISLCHYYKQNGDLMQDPEMCFIMIDKRESDKKDFEKVMLIPYLYQQANMGIYEESLTFKNEIVKEYDVYLQQQHADFANQWLQSIVQQGFLKSGDIQKL